MPCTSLSLLPHLPVAGNHRTQSLTTLDSTQWVRSYSISLICMTGFTYREVLQSTHVVWNGRISFSSKNEKYSIMCVCVYMYMCTCVYKCGCVYIGICEYMYICEYIYIWFLFSTFIGFIGVTLDKKLYNFQLYNSMTYHLYIVLCVHHPKSSLLPSLFIPLYSLLSPLTPFMLF